MMFYALPAALTLGLALKMAFLSPEGAKPSDDVWLLMGLITLLWPITLPCILLHQYNRQQTKPQAADEDPSVTYVTT